jgi:hypothetical protein
MPRGGVEIYLFSFFNLDARWGWVVYVTSPTHIGPLTIVEFCIKLIKIFKSCRLFYLKHLNLLVLFLARTSLNKIWLLLVIIFLSVALVESVGPDKVLSSNDSGNVKDELSRTSVLKMETVFFETLLTTPQTQRHLYQ